MGRGNKKKTLKLKEKPQTSCTVNCSVSARNLGKNDLAAVIFGCKHSTIAECYSKQLFGLPGSHFSYVKNIRPGMPLFLFNYSDRKLYGIFEAESAGQMNIYPYAWTADGAVRTPYPAQACVRIQRQCQPLKEDQYGPIIADNYYEPRIFWQELDQTQTKKLISLFLQSPVDVSASPRHDIPRRNTLPSKKQNKARRNTPVNALPKSDRRQANVDVEGLVQQNPNCAETYSSVVASSSTSNQQKTWSSLFKSSTSAETLREDEGFKKQPSELSLSHSNPFNKEWESSSVTACLEGESQNLEALREDSPMWNEEELHAGSESEGEVSCPTFEEGAFFEALVDDTKQEGEHGDDVVLYKNFPCSDGSNRGWDSSRSTPRMSGEIEPSEASMHDDVTKVYEEEVWEHFHSSPDNHGEASDHPSVMYGVNSENEGSAEALAVAHMKSVVAKLVQEIEELKDSKLKQDQKIGSLEKELVRFVYGEASDHPFVMYGVKSENGGSAEALAVADMKSVVAKLVQEIEGLKDSQLKQDQKIGSLENELVESKAEIRLLKNRCDLLESGISPFGYVQEMLRKDRQHRLKTG